MTPERLREIRAEIKAREGRTLHPQVFEFYVIARELLEAVDTSRNDVLEEVRSLVQSRAACYSNSDRMDEHERIIEEQRRQLKILADAIYNTYGADPALSRAGLLDKDGKLII